MISSPDTAVSGGHAALPASAARPACGSGGMYAKPTSSTFASIRNSPSRPDLAPWNGKSHRSPRTRNDAR